MKVIVTGGTGLIGTTLVATLASEGHQIVVLTRSSGTRAETGGLVTFEQWDAKTQGTWTARVNGADAVINLAGESIGAKRWSSSQKKRIVGSRISATRAVVEAIGRVERKPTVLINGSAVGYYGPVEEGDVTESSPRGEGFLAETCELWEKEALKASAEGCRVVVTRTAVVLGDGGALQRMLLPFRLFAGGTIGSGRQWFPWIHVQDAAGAITFALRESRITGPVNLSAPEVPTMKDFTRTLGRVLRRPTWAPVPALVLRIVLGELSGMILTGQRVVPTKLQQYGYSFRFPSLNGALNDILG